MLNHHSNGASAEFRRKLVCHRPYFSRVGVSGKAGAFQKRTFPPELIVTDRTDALWARKKAFAETPTLL